MNNWEILLIDNKKEWNDLVNSCKQPDIHFTPEYMQLFEDHVGGKASLFVQYNSDKSNYVLYPFFKRKINDLENFSGYEQVIFDIISPWYFGGPLLYSATNKIEMLNLFLNNFNKFANENNIITEFTRIHPLLFSSSDFIQLSGAVYKYHISYVDLQVAHEDIWQNFKKSNRNAINASRRKGVKIHSSKSIDAMKIFYELYIKSMNRLKANKSYFLSFSFFENLLKVLSDNIVIFTATHQGIPISSSLFLFKSGIVHYWLSGSDLDYKNLYSNNLLLFEAIKWAKDDGNQTFLLMGGSSEGLRSFKESFSKNTTCFYTLNKIHDVKTYSILNEIRSNHNVINSDSEFFPSYRG